MAETPRFRGDPVYQTNDISNVCSTTTPLSGLATFTSDSIDVTNFNTVNVGVIASHAGTLTVEFSPDGTNWDYVNSVDVGAGVYEHASVPVKGRHARVLFENLSGSTQSYIRLQTILGSGYSSLENSGVVSDVSLISQGVHSTIRNNFASNSVTTTWETIVTLTDDANYIHFEHQAGTALELRVGTSGNAILTIPRGASTVMPFRAVSGSVIQVQTVSGTLSAGELILNFSK